MNKLHASLAELSIYWVIKIFFKNVLHCQDSGVTIALFILHYTEMNMTIYRPRVIYTYDFLTFVHT